MPRRIACRGNSFLIGALPNSESQFSKSDYRFRVRVLLCDAKLPPDFSKRFEHWHPARDFYADVVKSLETRLTLPRTYFLVRFQGRDALSVRLAFQTERFSVAHTSRGMSASEILPRSVIRI